MYRTEITLGRSCTVIKVKPLPPAIAPFGATLKKALRLNRDPASFLPS